MIVLQRALRHQKWLYFCSIGDVGQALQDRRNGKQEAKSGTWTFTRVRVAGALAITGQSHVLRPIVGMDRLRYLTRKVFAAWDSAMI